MTRKMLTVSAACVAAMISAPAMAGPGGGGGPPMHGGAGGAGPAGSMGPGGPAGAGTMTGSGSPDFQMGAGARAIDRGSAINRIPDTDDMRPSQINQRVDRAEARASSGAFQHAPAQAFERANPNSILARNAVPTAMLPGLTTGVSVQTSAGTSLGTVTSVLTTSTGSIAGVVVTAANGQTYRVPASALSISGSTLTVNTAEAYERGPVPFALLPGLTTGLSVTSSTGASLGTVTSIQTGANGSVQSVTVTGSNGQTYRIPANALSISNNMVSVNTTEAFETRGVPSSLLPGLTTGLTVDTAAGGSFGTVTQVMTGANGSITGVVVTTASGQTYTVPASSLSISGNVVTVASTGEAFEGTGVPSAFLPGLTSGLAVNMSGGTSLGTVSQVITGTNGTVTAVIVTGAGGQTYTVPATDLTISGNVVTVASAG